MASVTVFVDDAVRGSLPRVCCRDGAPTGDSILRHDEIGDRAGLGVAWLLLLAGPLGWLGLVVLSFSRSGRIEQLHVELPMSQPAYERMRAARQLRDRSTLILTVAGASAALLYIGRSTTLTQVALVVAACAAAASLLTLMTGSVRYHRESVGVTLDASRRWITLSNVHPRFAAACEAYEAAQARHT